MFDELKKEPDLAIVASENEPNPEEVDAENCLSDLKGSITSRFFWNPTMVIEL